MKLRTIVLLAILLSISKMYGQNTTPQALSQFTIDVILNIGLEEGIDTLKKYKGSEKFYSTDQELFNIGQILYRQQRSKDALYFTKEIKNIFPSLNNSLALHLFEMLVENGASSTQEWLNTNQDYSRLYLKEDEFDMATTSFLRTGKIAECKVINSIYLNEFPHNQEAHFQMAEIYDAEGNTTLALQYFRSGVETEKYISFSKLASDPLSIYIPTILPRDTTSLFHVDGDMSKDTAWVFVQGGPMPDISAYNPRPLSLLPNQENLLKVDVLQSQMINQSILSADIPLTNKQNLYEHKVSAEMLHRTVRYLKERGKIVFVIGHSYGAYISYEYLRSKEDLSDRLIIMGGDLDEDLRNYEMNEDGTRKFIRFRNGVTPYESTFWGRFTLERIFKPKLEKIFTNTGNLVACHGKQRFTELLKGKDLSNVIFYHAKFDEANGKTTKAELDFWKSHGAITIETYGDHHSMLSAQVIENIYNHLSSSMPLKQSIASILSDDIDELGINRAIQNYKEDNCKDCFPLEESEINALGYQLVASNRLEEAIKIFELNVDAFPSSWNAYDSLGETYLALGNTILGHTYYRKSLELHPGNIYAIMALR